MAFDSFMGSAPDHGFITLQDPPAPAPQEFTPNPKMKNFGNTEMATFKTDSSAMNIVNSPKVKRDFDLGSAYSCHAAPWFQENQEGRPW